MQKLMIYYRNHLQYDYNRDCFGPRPRKKLPWFGIRYYLKYKVQTQRWFTSYNLTSIYVFYFHRAGRRSVI